MDVLAQMAATGQHLLISFKCVSIEHLIVNLTAYKSMQPVLQFRQYSRSHESQFAFAGL